MFNRDWTTSSNFINYSTLNSEHNWEDLRIQITLDNGHWVDPACAFICDLAGPPNGYYLILSYLSISIIPLPFGSTCH